MKTVQVAAAVIRNGYRFFATQRGYGPLKDGWEFPGGKIEAGETPQAALIREIREELDAEITVGEKLTQVELDTPEFHLSMGCYFCTLQSGHLTLREHESARWLALEEIDAVDWLPADQIAVGRLKAYFREHAPAAEKKIAVLLPGIGYTCDRPLLYYSGKLAQTLGWEVARVPYGGFPEKVRGDAEKMRQSAETAIRQTKEILRPIDWTQYSRMVFISKSVGTVAAADYAHTLGLPCRHILFTPVEATFAFPIKNAVAFHGTADPWAETEKMTALCERARIPLYLTENANHSLETGEVQADIRILEGVMRRVQAVLEEEGDSGRGGAAEG